MPIFSSWFEVVYSFWVYTFGLIGDFWSNVGHCAQKIIKLFYDFIFFQRGFDFLLEDWQILDRLFWSRQMGILGCIWPRTFSSRHLILGYIYHFFAALLVQVKYSRVIENVSPFGVINFTDCLHLCSVLHS